MKLFDRLARRTLLAVGLDVRRAQPPAYGLESYERLYGGDAVRQKRFYNLGAGAFFHPAWTNVDHSSDAYREVTQRHAYLEATR